MTVKTSVASHGLKTTSAESPPRPLLPPTPPSKSESKTKTRLAFSVDSLLSTVAASKQPQKYEDEEAIDEEDLGKVLSFLQTILDWNMFKIFHKSKNHVKFWFTHFGTIDLFQKKTLRKKKRRKNHPLMKAK